MRFVAALMLAVCGLVAGCTSSPRARDASSDSGKRFAFWPVAPDEPRIQFVRSFRTSKDVTERESGALAKVVFGKEDESLTAIQKPYGVAMRNGRIYVCDIRGRNLTVLDLTQRQVRLVGVTGLHPLAHPVDVALADDGEIYVADNERDAIMVYDAQERFSRIMGRKGMEPISVAVHADRLYVCDKLGQRIEILDRRSGATIGTFGTVGDEDGQFRLPLGVETDRAGNVYVVDMMRCRVQKFDRDGKFLSGIGEMGDYAGSFARPKHVAVDQDGIVYVVDSAFQNVQMFNDQWQLLMHFGAIGDFPGAMNLPVGICVAEGDSAVFDSYFHAGFKPRRLIVVTNQFGPAPIAVYALGDRRDGYTVADLAASAVQLDLGVGLNPGMADLQDVGEEPGAGGDAAQPPPGRP